MSKYNWIKPIEEYDFTLNGSKEVLSDQFQFETDIIKQKNYNEEEEIVIVEE